MKSCRLLLSTAAILPTIASAATKTWDYGNSTANWADATNWNTDGVPAAGDTVNFTTTGNTPTAITLNTSYQDTGNPIALGFTYGKDLSIGSTATNELYVGALTVSDAYTYTLDIAKNGTQGNSGTMPLAGATWNIATGGTFVVKTAFGTKSGVGSGNINKSGSGTLKLGDGTANAVSQYLALNAQAGVTELGFTSGTTVNGISGISSGATVKITAAGTAQTLLGSGTYSYQAGVTGVAGTFDLNGYDQTIASLSGTSATGSVTNTGSSDSTLTIGIGTYAGRNESSGTFAGVISDGTTNKLSVTINPKNTAFVETFTGTNTYTGTTTISAGKLQIGNGGTTGTLGAGNVTNNAQLTFNRADATAYSGIISGTGAVTKEGAGTLTLSGTNTYTGTTTVSAGTLLVNGALGNTAVTVAASATVGGTGTLGGSLSLGGTSFFNVVNIADALGVSGAVTFGSGFGIDNLTGLNWDSLALNTPYTIINSSQDFSTAGLDNYGIANAFSVGTGRMAYFENGLNIVVIPEPSVIVLGSLGLIALSRRRRS